jgi:hypothetical protein
MKARAWLAAAVVATGWAAAAPGEMSSDQVDRLVNRLGSGAYREREAASRELDTLGAAALDALRRAAASADPETRRRAADLVERIGGRVAAARMMAATTVEFKYDNKSLDDAVKDFARRTGAAITLHDRTPNRFRGRTVTAATPGPAPFWEALELLCRKADLHEWDGFAKVDGLQPAQQGNQAMFLPNGGQVFIARRGGMRQAPPPNQIVLLDGPVPAGPVVRAGAVRLRLPPPGTPIDGVTPIGSDEVIVPIQVSAEPKLNFQGVADLRIDRAVDDRGRTLTAVSAVRELPADEEDMIFINGMIMPAGPQKAGPAGVRIQRGDKPAARLAELAGMIAARVRIAEPLAVADAPLKPGPASRTSYGVGLKIVTATKADSGEWTVTVEATLPLDVQLNQPGGVNGMMFGGGFGGQVVVRAAVIGPGGQQQQVTPTIPAVPNGTTEYQGLSLQDAKGRRFSVTRGMFEMNRFTQDGAVYQFTAVFKPAEAGQEPARLVLTASRPAMIEIPFTVRDVPLQ